MINSNNNNPTVFATPAILLLLLLSLLSFSSPSLTMAQQTGATTTTTTTTTPSPLTTGQTTAPSPSPPLTPQEQEQQTRLQNVIAATNQNLDETEKQVGGVVYTPRWSDPVWVEPDSAAVLVAYCLPGEFAESGQEILGGGFELEVLESYEVALPQNFMAWMMVIGNEDRQNRYPAAVGVICASDANDAETRVASPEEQQQINNVVQQFRTTTSIDQVINIINNATTPTPTPTQPPGPPGRTPTPECPEGSTFNPDTDQCEQTETASPTCPEGSTFNPDTDQCERAVIDACPFGTTLNPDLTRCEGTVIQPPQCPPQTTLNPDTTKCEGTQTAPPECPTGFTFNAATDQCEQTPTPTPTPTPPPPAGGSSSSVGGITISDLHIDFLTPSGAVASDTNTYNGPCPVGASISGTITDNVRNRDVTYRLIMNDGTRLEGVRQFDQPESQRVSFGISTLADFNNVQSYQGWFAIEILQPVQLQSNRVEFQVTCTAPDTGGAAQAPQTLQAENTTTATGTTTDEEDTTAATTDEEEEQDTTTTDGAGATGDTTGGGGGTDTGDTDNADQSPPATIDEEGGAVEGAGGAAASPAPANDEGGGGG